MVESEVVKRMGKKVGSTEIEIIQHLAEDKSIAETAVAMEMSHRGIESRLLKLRGHFKVHSAAALVAIFFRNKLIQ